jgi:hypothetical protein
MLSKLFKKNIPFSEFGDLGNLHTYTLDRLKSQIKRMEIKEEKKDALIYVSFTEPFTKIVLSFHLNGAFNKIESQEYDS